MRRLALGLILALFAAPAFSAAPTIDASESTIFTGADASYAVNIPGDACTSSQQLVIIAGTSVNSTTLTWPTGYTEFAIATAGGSNQIYGAYRNCDGTEGTTFTVTPSASGRAVFITFKISGDDGAEPQEAINANGNDAAPDAPNLTPSGGSADYLWIVGYSVDNGPGAVTLSACPTNYTTNCASAESGNSNSVHVLLGWSWRAATASSEDPGTATLSGTENWDAMTIAVAPAGAAAPAFSVNPSCSATTDGVSCTYTADATSTAYGVGVALADGIPTCTQIKAGQNDGGTAALATGSDANTGGVGDTIVVSGTNKPPRLDYHFCLNNANGDSAVDSGQAAKDRTAKSGFQIAFPSSLAGTSPFADTAYFDPDFAVARDGVEIALESNETASCDLSVEADGDVIWTPATGTECDGKRTANVHYEYGGSATDGLFTAPGGVGNFTTPDMICLNNAAPTAAQELESPLIFTLGVPMTPIDLSQYFTDDDGGTHTYTVTGGTSLPAGTSLSGTGNKDWSGTPNTEVPGASLQVTATDECDATAVFNFTSSSADFFVVDVGDTEASPAKVVFELTSVTGLTKWVDYIPVAVVPGCVHRGRQEEDGCWEVTPLASAAGLRAWVDYIPVFEVSQTANKWRYENDGWIPVNTLTP